ncbi:hypothetical protein KY290_036563 [Solanum tuberosum]|uniref:Polyprotein protein n=1 Tax=Solanum tuberosum TaxID=4113 RepID=A0ABQ7TUK5_SOLTU|nr:hypothetical protein KY289_036049 [Solanum tuberosum]KAH0639290.1 hypothetical protein KY285_035876 [Solanum tuberosum]KAH0737858.1 hypothetical protein KY290_036563 [Solanum tuberosum]
MTDSDSLHRDVDEFKSTDISMLSAGVDIPEATISEFPSIDKIEQMGHANSEIPPVVVSGYAADPDIPETHEEDLVDCEIDVYEDLEELEGDMLQFSTKASLHEIFHD